MSEFDTETKEEKIRRVKTLATFVYALQALSFFAGITFIVGLIVNYVKRDDVAGTFAESHFDWQIKTFWVALGLTILGILTLIILVGYVILFAASLWLIYRIVKGWLYLNDERPIY